MTWPLNLYCATKALGVYFSSDFTLPSTQPTWAAVNGGLPATDVRQFALDPFVPADKQYLLLETARALYLREDLGNWASILTSAAVRTLLSESADGTIKSFCVDPYVEGRLWAAYEGHNTSGDVNTVYALYSDDYGATWTAATRIAGGSASERAAHYIKAYGDLVFITWNTGAGWVCSYSTDKGSTWTDGGGGTFLEQNPLQPDRVYYSTAGSGTLYSYTSGGTATALDGASLGRMWCSALDEDHQRILENSYLFVTDDSWATKNTPSGISPNLGEMAPWFGSDENQIGVEMILDLDPGGNRHAVGVLYEENDVIATGIAGANCDSSPYTDSIPETCGGVAVGGFVAVPDAVLPSEGPSPPSPSGGGGTPPTITPPGGSPIPLAGSANVQAVTMPSYAGTERGEPLPGDRGAWAVDTDAHAALHASDILAEAPTRHTPSPVAETGKFLKSDGTKNVFDAVPIPDAGDIPYTPTVLTDWDGDADPGDATDALDQLAERTDDLEADSHAAVTLGGASDAALALSGQELTLTLPAAGSPDAGDVTYTPAVATDWDGDADPGNADDALDQLAERVDDLEGVAPGTDANAIHDNVASEIHAITEKTTPVDADELLVEDSADSYNKKRVKFSNLPSGGSGGATDVLQVQIFS